MSPGDGARQATADHAAATPFKIGMPPGMDGSLDTVPSSDVPSAAPVANVPDQAPVPLNRPAFGVAPVRVPPATNQQTASGSPGHGSSAAQPAAPRLLLPDGVVLPLGDGVIVGRDPQHQEGYGVRALARLHDTERSVSKTHAVVGVSEGRVWVIDLNSTNGTTIVGRDGTEQQCPAEVATPVPRGSDIRFGEYLVRVALD